MFEHSEVMRKVRSAVARTAHRWRKRLKVKQLRIESLEEDVRLLRNDLLRTHAALVQKGRDLERYTREAMLETRFTTAKDIYA